MLTNTTEIQVRFNEVDSMGIVWHGHYLKYFEDGREGFGREFNLGYFDVFDNHKLYIPIVKIDCKYKRAVKYKEPLLLETEFVNSKAAKIVFNYRLYNSETKVVCATGSSEQVFLDLNKQLQLITPEFFIEWKQRWNIPI